MTTITQSNFSSHLADFWKDDFAPLQSAGKAVLAALRADEEGQDLFHRMTQHSSTSHLYFPSSHRSWRHVQSDPLPPLIAEHLANVKRSSVAGLLAPAGLAWMSVDHCLYLWPLRHTANDNVLRWEIPNKECVVSVGLAKPKKGMFSGMGSTRSPWSKRCTTGVFTGTVEWCIVVSTPLEVLLCALTHDGRLVPTSYALPTDGVKMLCVSGTSDGRIFLGGEDDCLYEMIYEGRIHSQNYAKDDVLHDFYEGKKQLPAVLTIDRDENVKSSTVSTFLGKRIRHSSTSQPRKCRKFNRSSNQMGFLRALIPTFVSGQSAFSKGKKIGVVQVLTDEGRGILYSLSSNGWIRAYSLSNVVHKSSINTRSAVRKYLEGVSRGQSTPSRMLGDNASILFPAGNSAAKAGVGGMDGARSILKAISKSEDLVQPRSIHLVPPTESSRITLVAITGGGLRLYLSALPPSVVRHGLSQQNQHKMNSHSPQHLSLCHIRGPPVHCSLLDTSASSRDSNLGRTPVVGGTIPNVNASLHIQDSFLMAVEAQNSTGNVMVSTCRTHSFRTTEESKTHKVSSSIPLGIAEEVALPMSQARSKDSLIPGGITWDMANVPASTGHFGSSQSQTPSDQDLAGYPPPAYRPPPDLVKTPGSIAVPGSCGHQSALSVLGHVLTNMIVTRPPQFAVPKSRLVTENGLASRARSYRVSTREGLRGFSGVAEPKHKLGVKSGIHAERLRPWLLKPTSVPTHPLASDIFVTQPEGVAVLNAGGVHYFELENLLNTMASAILCAGENVANDQSVNNLFEAYGYKEGCTMCICLALGCGHGQSSWSKDLRSRAIHAALARGLHPALIPLSSDMPGSIGTVVCSVNSLEPLVPAGYWFKPSELSQAVHSTFSRLVRPIWYRPVVVVTEGPSVQQEGISGLCLQAARVELLLNPMNMLALKEPLQNLLQLMRKHLERAVKSVPGHTAVVLQQSVFGERSGDRTLTDSLYHQSQQASLSRQNSSQTLSSGAAESIARLIEEKNIHSLYRLASRAVQLLDAVAILCNADSVCPRREVDWGRLHGLTVAQLTQTIEGQSRVEGLLNSVATWSPALDFDASHFSAPTELAEEFSERCYHYFSPGSKFASQGFRAAYQALNCHEASSQRLKLVSDASQCFLKAASHWHSAPLVVGSKLSKKTKEPHAKVISHALNSGSLLAAAVGALFKLNEIDCAVKICLVVAANFSASSKPGTPPAAGFELAWEHRLYHNPSPGGTTLTQKNVGLKQTPSVANGVEVTAQDAIDTCFSLIFYHLSQQLQLLGDGAKRMLEICISSSDDGFLQTLFSFLIESGNTDMLLKIRSAKLEQWLLNYHDTGLVARYFAVQGKHEKAGDLLREASTSDECELHIATRIEGLSKALNAYQSALQTVSRGMSPTEDLSDKMEAVDELLQVARVQLQILKTLEAHPASEVEDKRILSTKLVPVTDLFNNYASVHDMFETCLQILGMCKKNDPELISVVWVHIIAREILPCKVKTEATYTMLREIMSEVGRQDDVLIMDSPTAAPVFENGDWITGLSSTIVKLGKALYGKGSDFVFPTEFLMSALQELSLPLSGTIGPGWPLLTLVNGSVPHVVVLKQYDRLSLASSSISLEQQVLAKLETLEAWVHHVDTNRMHADLHYVQRTIQDAKMALDARSLDRIEALQKVLAQAG